MGSKGTFISPVHRDRQEIEIPAEGGKVAGIAELSSVTVGGRSSFSKTRWYRSAERYGESSEEMA